MIETTKKALYASVGAPVLTVRRVNEKFQELTAKLRETDLTKEFDAWATEGEKLVERFSDQRVIAGWSAKLDDLYVPAQVGKLREQLDDMVENWRKNFRPADEAVTVPVTEEKPATKTTKKPAARKPATTKTSTSTKSAGAKKPAAKKPTAKATKKA